MQPQYPDNSSQFLPENPYNMPPPPLRPWHVPHLPPAPHHSAAYEQELPQFPPRRHQQRRRNQEAPGRRGAAAAARWEPPPQEQPGPRPFQRHGAQRGAIRDAGGLPIHPPRERIVQEGARLRTAQITNIRVIVPVVEVVVRQQRDAATQCNRPWEDFMGEPLPEGYVLPPGHQGGPFIRLARSPTPPPLMPITWMEMPAQMLDPNDLPEYVSLEDLQRLQQE